MKLSKAKKLVKAGRTRARKIMSNDLAKNAKMAIPYPKVKNKKGGFVSIDAGISTRKTVARTKRKEKQAGIFSRVQKEYDAKHRKNSKAWKKQQSRGLTKAMRATDYAGNLGVSNSFKKYGSKAKELNPKAFK